MSSNLITHGLGGTLITHGMGGTSVIIQPPIIKQGTGGGAVLVPQAIVKGEILIKIEHLPIIKRLLKIETLHIEVLERLPIAIHRVFLNIATTVTELFIKSTSKGLSLNITAAGIDIDENQS